MVTISNMQNKNPNSWYTNNSRGLAFVTPTNNKNDYWLLHKNQPCRSVTTDYWCSIKHGTTFQYTETHTLENKYNEEKTYLYYGTTENKENLVFKLKELNEKEVKYGITPTVMEEVNKIDGVIFIGDPAWQSNAWKLTMYTYYLKKIVSDTEVTDYDGALTKTYIGKPHEEILLKKVTTLFDEWIPENKDWEWTHNQTGFVSCSLYPASNSPGNQPMYDLIFKGIHWNDIPKKKKIKKS